MKLFLCREHSVKYELSAGGSRDRRAGAAGVLFLSLFLFLSLDIALVIILYLFLVTPA